MSAGGPHDHPRVGGIPVLIGDMLRGEHPETGDPVVFIVGSLNYDTCLYAGQRATASWTAAGSGALADYEFFLDDCERIG